MRPCRSSDFLSVVWTIGRSWTARAGPAQPRRALRAVSRCSSADTVLSVQFSSSEDGEDSEWYCGIRGHVPKEELAPIRLTRRFEHADWHDGKGHVKWDHWPRCDGGALRPSAADSDSFRLLLTLESGQTVERVNTDALHHPRPKPPSLPPLRLQRQLHEPELSCIPSTLPPGPLQALPIPTATLPLLDRTDQREEGCWGAGND